MRFDRGGVKVLIAARDFLEDVALNVVIAERQRLGLRKPDLACRQRRLGLIAQIVEDKPPFDRRRRKARLCREIVKGRALADERRERRRLIERRQVFALHVLDSGKAQLVVLRKLGADFGLDAVIRSDLAALLQQLQRPEAPLAADDAEALAPAAREDKVLQEPVLPDAGGKALKARRIDHRARVALRRLDGLQRDHFNTHGLSP